MVSDNRPQFISEEFEIFCFKNGINHIKTPPYHAKSKGAAERTVQILKQALLKLELENNKEPIQHQLDNILFAYRNTPQTTGKIPAEVFLCRKPRTRLAMLKENLETSTGKFKSIKAFDKNETIYVKSKRGEDEKWIEGTVIDKVSNYTYLIESANRHELVHIDDLKKCLSKVSNLEQTTNSKNLDVSLVPNSSYDSNLSRMNKLINNNLNSDSLRHGPNADASLHSDCDAQFSDIIGNLQNTQIQEKKKSVIETDNQNSELRRSSRIRKPTIKLDL